MNKVANVNEAVERKKSICAITRLLGTKRSISKLNIYFNQKMQRDFRNVAKCHLGTEIT